MNHTRFPKKDHLPDWPRQDNEVRKGDRVECLWGEMRNAGGRIKKQIKVIYQYLKLTEL